MKILLCTPTFRTITHGPAKFAQLSSRINDLYPEHELRILTEEPLFEHDHRIIQLKVYCPRPLHAINNFIRSIRYHHASLKVYKEFPFDVVVYNNAILALWAGLMHGKKFSVVGMLNDYENLSITRKPRKGQLLRKWLIRSVFRWAERRSLGLLDGIIVCSDFLKKQVQDSYRILPKRVYRLYKGIDVSEVRFRSRTTIGSGGKVHVLFVKAAFKTGGLPTLLQAMAKLPAYQFKLSVIGPDKRKRMEIQPDLDPLNNVGAFFLGPQSQQSVFRHLQEADILCIPSIREGLGVANIEGLAAGIPVVTSDVGGIPEVLGGGTYGWMAEARNPDELAYQLQQCLNNSSQRMAKSIAGRKFVERVFDYPIMLENFLQILGSVTNGKQTGT